MKTRRILSGIQPSGRLHLGNYLGSLTNLVKMQEDHELFVFVADLHSITVDFAPVSLAQNRKEVMLACLSAGLNPVTTSIFLQSEIYEHATLAHILLCHSTLGELERMTQFKTKIKDGFKQSNSTVKIPTGLLTYPTLMAADILLYEPDDVIVGADQKQHIELARDLALRMNAKYGNIFKIPEPLIPTVGARIMDLADPTKKMSKSSKNHKGVIFLDETSESLKLKIKSAKTDSLNKVCYNQKLQPEVSNLLTIYFVLINENSLTNLRKTLFYTSEKILMADIEKKYLDKNYAFFKEDLFTIINHRLQLMRLWKEEYDATNKIKEQIEVANKRAQAIAQKTLKKVYEHIGFKKI